MEGLTRAAPALVLVAVLLVFLAVTVRLSLSGMRTRNARERLRHPQPEEVRRLVGYSPPGDLVSLYRESPLVDHVEFDLVDASRTPPAVWSIMGFTPLTGVDVKEWCFISGIDKIPIAYDFDKGVYYVDREGRVMLCSPNVPGRTIEVAPTVRAFAAFRPASNSPDDE